MTEDETFNKLRKVELNNIDGRIRKWCERTGFNISDCPDVENSQEVKEFFESIGWTLEEYREEYTRIKKAEYNALTPDEKAIEDAMAEFDEQQAIKASLDSGITQEDLDKFIKENGPLTGIR